MPFKKKPAAEPVKSQPVPEAVKDIPGEMEAKREEIASLRASLARAIEELDSLIGMHNRSQR